MLWPLRVELGLKEKMKAVARLDCWEKKERTLFSSHYPQLPCQPMDWLLVWA